MSQKDKCKFIVGAAMIWLGWVLLLVLSVKLEEMQYSPLLNMVSVVVIVIAVLAWIKLFIKAKSNTPMVLEVEKIMAFEAEKFTYCPENKQMLSLDETMYFMRDKLLVHLFYGIAVFMWVFTLIILDIGIFFFEGIRISEILILNICMLFIFMVITGIYLLILYISKKTKYKEELINNTQKYVGIDAGDICEILQQDLEKGMRFRSKKLILTQKYILGTVSDVFLSPVAIPARYIKDIRYELVVQMFEHYGFDIKKAFGYPKAPGGSGR